MSGLGYKEFQRETVGCSGDSTNVGGRKTGLPLPRCDLERAASWCLDALNHRTILLQGIGWLSGQDGREIKFSVDALDAFRMWFHKSVSLIEQLKK